MHFGTSFYRLEAFMRLLGLKLVQVQQTRGTLSISRVSSCVGQ